MGQAKAASGRLGWAPAMGAMAAAAFLCLWWWLAPQPSPARLARELGEPLLRLLFYLALGLLVGQALESLGWAGRMAALAQPLLRLGRLKPESAASFTAACFSGLLGNTLLMTFHQEGRLSRRELVLTYLVNSGLPVFLLHLPTTFFIIYPLTRQAGLIYLGLTLAAAILRTALVLAISRLSLPPPEPAAREVPAAPGRHQPLGRAVWQKFQRRFLRVAAVTLPVYLAVFVAQEGGLFRWLRDVMAVRLTLGFMPVEAAGIVAFSVAAEFTSGVAAAGALLHSGVLTVRQTVYALVLANLVAAPIRALRHQLPSHAGIFSPGLGLRLLLASQGLRLASLVAVTLLYGVWG